MTESEIRSALHHKRLRNQKSNPTTLVIDELGLAHARSRIDIAVINGHIHGYEIKSAQDNLGRLDRQMEVYKQTLQKLTIVSVPVHMPKILHTVPTWCGLIEVERGPRTGIRLRPIRPASFNPDVVPVMLAHLLWRTEALNLLTRIGYSPKELRHPRKRLYEMLCEGLTTHELTTAIREFMALRHMWRDHPTRA